MGLVKCIELLPFSTIVNVVTNQLYGEFELLKSVKKNSKLYASTFKHE